jgi:NADH-quinone oxidoreductase subunit E
MILNKENQEKYEQLVKKYPKKDSLMLPLLWLVQYQEGWISKDGMKLVASLIDTTVANVYGVATFYTMFNLKPVGKTHIEVCKSISCKLNGSSLLINHIEKKLNIKSGQTTKDQKFTFSKVECMGACGGAPMIALNGKYYENLSVEKLDELLEDLANEKLNITLEGEVK